MNKNIFIIKDLDKTNCFSTSLFGELKVGDVFFVEDKYSTFFHKTSLYNGILLDVNSTLLESENRFSYDHEVKTIKSFRQHYAEEVRGNGNFFDKFEKSEKFDEIILFPCFVGEKSASTSEEIPPVVHIPEF